MKKALLIGANGLVGKNLVPLLQKQFEVVKASRSTLPSFDLTDLDGLKNFDFTPYSLVVLSANLGGGVNFCETHPEESERFHFLATQRIVEKIKALNIPFVYLSSDYVFSDHLKNVGEQHPTAPLNQYGRDKDKSEKAIIASLKSFLIIRTTNVYGWDPTTTTPNYFMTVYRKLLNHESLKAPTNFFCTPTFVGDLAESIYALITANQTGIFHVVGDEFLSRYDWAKAIAQNLNQPSSLIEDFEDLTEKPKRPAQLKLSNQKVLPFLGHSFKSLETALKLMKDEIQRSTS